MGPTLETGVEIHADVFFLKNFIVLRWLKIKIKYSFLNYEEKKNVFSSDIHLKTFSRPPFSFSDFYTNIVHWGVQMPNIFH